MITRFLSYLRISVLILALASCVCGFAVGTGRMFSDLVFTAGTYNGFCRDADGFLWIATDGGLMKFDGINYTLYRHEDNNPNSLSDSRTRVVMADSKGRVWAATENGLNLYDSRTDSFKRLKLPSKSYDGYIMDIAELSDGTIIYIVAGIGLYVVEEGDGEPQAVRYMLNLPDEVNQVCLIQSSDGHLYIGTQYGKVYQVSSNGSARKVDVADGYITDIIQESDGNILVSSVNDIYRILPAENYRVEQVHSSDNAKMHINNFTAGTNGKVFFTTAGNGLWSVTAGAKSAEPYKSVYVPSIDIWSVKLGAVYSDREGNLWIGCHYKGLACIPYNSIPFNYRLISDALPDYKGGLDGFAVVGSNTVIGYGNNIAVINSGGRVTARKEIPARGTVTSIIPYGSDRILIGMANDGVWEMSLSGSGLRRFIDMPGKYPKIEMCVLPGGDLLVGFHGLGLMRYNPKTKAQKWYETNPEGARLSNPFFSAMEMTADSTAVWIGLYGGISYYEIEADEFRIMNQSPFVQGATYAFAPMPDGSVMAGTSHGLIHYDTAGNLIRKYTTADGFTDNDIRSISVDDKGGCWIGTMRGLNYLPADTNGVAVYYGGHGLFESAFPYSAVTPDRQIILGSNLGLTQFDPDSVLAGGFDVKVHPTSILLNGKPITQTTEIDGNVVIDGDDPLSLKLPYKDNSLTVRLSTLDFRDAANVRYMWRIDGYSDEWRITDPGENVIYLPHLDPGEYRLCLKAVDNDILSDQTELRIVISTPWYMSGVAKLLYAVVLITILVLSIVVVRKKREERINEAKIRFFIDVSHDIRSPVTLIMTPLQSLLKEPFAPEVNGKLRTMQRNCQRILSLVNQLLDLRKIEKGGMRLLCRPTNLDKFIEELVDMFKPQAADKKIELDFKNEGGVPDKAWVDRDNFDKILVNIISNAIKYTPEGGNIDVNLKGVDDKTLGPCAEVSVIDTGIGLGNKTPEQLFERFYRARENHSTGIAGVGIGLDLCRQLTTLHHGTISGSNRTDGVRGSVFTVRIPLDAEAYAPAELQHVAEGDNDSSADKRLLINDFQAGSPARKTKRKRLSVPRRVLIVDDDAELRDYISSHLDELGYKAVTAENGAEAMKIVNEGNLDLVISDVKMPIMDGIAFLRLMRSNVGTHHIPVILLSSRNDIADRIEGWDSGADGYLGKPFSIEELDTMVDSLIGNRLKLKGKFSGAQDVDAHIAPPEVKGYDEALMEKIMKTVNEQIDNPELNVEMLGQSIGISRVQLHRKLKELIGMTPSDFIRNIRLKRACVLLQKPDLEVTQVAYAVGFSSQPHFSTAFKRYTGFSPSEYKQRYLHGEIPPVTDNPSEKTQI